jgi:hypothetical protein
MIYEFIIRLQPLKMLQRGIYLLHSNPEKGKAFHVYLPKPAHFRVDMLGNHTRVLLHHFRALHLYSA